MVHISGWLDQVFIDLLCFCTKHTNFVFSLFLVDVGGCYDEKHNGGTQILKTDSCPQSEKDQNLFLVQIGLNYLYIGF